MKCFCVAHDSSRAAVGCADQRIYLYSLHSATLLRTLAVAHDLAALAVADKDHFLLAAGEFHNNLDLTLKKNFLKHNFTNKIQTLRG